MKLERLKKLHTHIKGISEKYAIQDVALKDTETALMQKYNVNDLTSLPAVIEANLLKQSKAKDLSSLPRTVETTYVAYKQSFFKLQSLTQEIEQFINTHETTGNTDNDEINWEYFPTKVDSEDAKMSEIVRTYELLSRQYVDFKLACQNADKQQNFQGKIAFDTNKERHVNLSPNDFSDGFVASICEPLESVLGAVSGKFDFNNVNQQLSSLRFDHIDEEFLHINFGKDSYATYFDNQSVHLPVRDTNTPEQNKKAENFVDAYLKKSGLPETIKPNLKALVTTLTNQGVLGQSVWNTFGNFFSIQDNRIMNFGKNYRLHVSFNEQNQLKVQATMAQDQYLLITGPTPVLTDIDSIIKMEFTIAVNVVNDAPTFTLVDRSIACSFTTPREYPMDIGKNALKDPKSVSSDKLNPFKSAIEYIAKFLGYNSVAALYTAKGGGELTSMRGKEEFGAAEFPKLVDLASQNSNHTNGKKLSDREKEFLMQISDQYKGGKISSQDISKQVCDFVNTQLTDPSLNSMDKLDYIYWLQFVRELKGSENFKDEVHNVYESLVKQFLTRDPNLLLEVAKNDAELYQEIVNPSSFFTKKLTVSNEYHAVMLAKYPLILKGNKGSDFVKLLNNMKPEVKLLFLENFIKNGNDITYLANLPNLTKGFFNREFVESLKSGFTAGNERVLDFMDKLMTGVPAATTKYFREPLIEVCDAYYKQILTIPAANFGEFLSSLKDDKLIERFGLKFVEELVVVLNQFACNPQDAAVVPEIATQLGRMLNTEAEVLMERGASERIFLGLKTVRMIANNTIRGPGQDEDDVSTSDDESFEVATVDEKQKVDLSRTEKKAESTTEKLKESEANSVISSAALAEKDSVAQKPEKEKTPFVSQSKGLKS